MDKNKNALEELKILLSSVNEVISQQFFEMQQKIDLLEQKVAQLENNEKGGGEIEMKVEDVVEEGMEAVVEEGKTDGLLNVDGFELDDNEEVTEEVGDDLGEDVIGEEDLSERVVEEEGDFNEEHIGEEEEAGYDKEDFEIEGDSKEIVLDKAKPEWYDWEVDYPGTHLDDISLGIGYNDRLIFIKELFYNSEDEYKRTIAELNGMERFRDAMEYIRTNFPDWNEESEEVYKFYMNVRRKLK